MPLAMALEEIHFPTNLQKLRAAQTRLKFEELFTYNWAFKTTGVRLNAYDGILFQKLVLF